MCAIYFRGPTRAVRWADIVPSPAPPVPPVRWGTWARASVVRATAVGAHAAQAVRFVAMLPTLPNSSHGAADVTVLAPTSAWSGTCLVDTRCVVLRNIVGAADAPLGVAHTRGGRPTRRGVPSVWDAAAARRPAAGAAPSEARRRADALRRGWDTSRMPGDLRMVVGRALYAFALRLPAPVITRSQRLVCQPPEVFAFDRARKIRCGSGLLWRLLRRPPGLVVLEGTGLSGGIPLIAARAVGRVRYLVSSGHAVGVVCTQADDAGLIVGPMPLGREDQHVDAGGPTSGDAQAGHGRATRGRGGSRRRRRPATPRCIRRHAGHAVPARRAPPPGRGPHRRPPSRGDEASPAFPPRHRPPRPPRRS